MKVKLNVKDKSVSAFLMERLLYPPNDRIERGGCSGVSVYNLMNDELLFKIDCGIEANEIVEIELEDRTNGSYKDLVNNYTYKAAKYDDVSIKLILIDFDIKLKTNRR